MTDLLIIGAGTAGLTAAIYGVRAGLSVEVLEQTIYGGQIISTTSIENYPGMPGVSGVDFANALHAQARDLGVHIRYQNVVSAALSGLPKVITTDKHTWESHAVIIASGAKPRKLGCPGEQAQTGRGVSYCATCDGAFHRGKDVVVVGGGNVAADDALVLSGLANKVWLVHRSDDFRADAHTMQLVRQKDNIEILTDTEVARINGDSAVQGVTVRNLQNGSVQDLAASGVFIAIGSQPDNGVFAGEIYLDAGGYIVAGEDCKTNLPGVFAAGDTRTKAVRQIVTAAADGAVAALAASEYIRQVI